MFSRVVVDLNFVISETTFFVLQRAIDQSLELINAERFELKNLRPGNERAVDVEKWIVSRRADQSQVSAFDVGKQNVLLRFVEVMDLVDEQNCFLTRSPDSIRRGGVRAPHFGDIAFHAAQAHELGVRYVSDD